MVTVRQMTDSDVGSVGRLEAENFSAPWSENAFREMLRIDYAHYYVAEDEGRIAGCCGLLHVADEGEITNMSVSMADRRQGIASMLLDCILTEGATLGIKAFTLEVRAGNQPAIELYHKFGFKGVGERRNFYEKPRENALIMWKR